LQVAAFNDQTVLVTGAGRGIGQHVALTYAAAGANVVVSDINFVDAQETVAQIVTAGGHAVAVQADMRKPEDIVALVAATIQHFGRLDILINNAGISRWTSPYELTVEAWDDVLHTNLRGAFLCAREAAAQMRQTGGGRIVNIASTRALMSEPNSEAYAASKGGLVAVTHALAVSLGPDDITVNAISPGWIETGEYEALRDLDHRQHPSGRVGRPADVSRACLYLTAPGNDFLTGQNLVLDGGMTRKMIYEE